MKVLSVCPSNKPEIVQVLIKIQFFVLHYGRDYSTHQIQVPIQVQVPSCQATPYYYITYDYKYPTQI